MSLDVEKSSLNEKDRSSRRDFATQTQPTDQKTILGIETLLEQDRATLMTLFEWLVPGRKRHELSSYVMPLFASKVTNFRGK